MQASMRPVWMLASLVVLSGAGLVVLDGADAQQSPPQRATVPADARTIEDDSTAVPDAEESADNNVSFPIDI